MIPWDKLHGAMTHFPIALLLFSTACDFVSVTFKKLPFARELRSVSFYGLAVAALASLGAVVSGIALTKGDMWGRGDLRLASPIRLAGVRASGGFGRLEAGGEGRDGWRKTVPVSDLDALASGFVAAAGYFGGELLLSGGGVP